MQSTESKAKGLQSDPYEQFLTAQKKQSLEWQSNREAKRAKVQSVAPAGAVLKLNDTGKVDHDCHQDDLVTLLRQQLATKTEECQELRNKNIEAVNARIIGNQENLVTVSFLKIICIIPCTFVWPDSYINKM